MGGKEDDGDKEVVAVIREVGGEGEYSFFFGLELD